MVEQPDLTTRIQTRKQGATGDELARVLPSTAKPWYREKHLLRLSYYCVSLCFLAGANGYDGSMMNGLQALPQWFEFMENPRGSWLGFINAAQALSSAVVFPLVAYVGNRWGRKRGLYIGYFFVLAGSLLQGLSPNKNAFLIARLLIGQPSAWWAGLAPLLITELAYPTHRASLTALFNCGYYIGSTVAAWATYGSRNYADSWAWRIPSLLQLAIPLIVLPAVIMVPESPRYLVSIGKSSKAREILTRYHGGGDEASPLVNFEMAEIEIAIEADRAIMKQTSWKSLLATKGNRHRTFISISLGISAQWNGVNVISYYLAQILKSVGITSVTQQTLISGCLQIWNLIIACSAAAGVDRVGRRPLFLTSCIGMLVSFAVVCGLSAGFTTTGNASIGVAVVPFLYIYYGFYDIAFTPLLVSYPAEIWPYELRARGSALMQMSAYGAIFFNVFVNPIALEAIAWKYYIVFIVILFGITIMIYFLYPETKGHTLEEMAVLFDGERATIISAGAATDKVEEHVTHKENV